MLLSTTALFLFTKVVASVKTLLEAVGSCPFITCAVVGPVILTYALVTARRATSGINFDGFCIFYVKSNCVEV